MNYLAIANQEPKKSKKDKFNENIKNTVTKESNKTKKSNIRSFDEQGN